MTRVKEVPPATDAKGEFSEVQVMEEGEIFVPSVFLDRLAKQWKQDPSSLRKPEFFRNSSSLTRGSTEILYSCPVHPNDTYRIFSLLFKYYIFFSETIICTTYIAMFTSLKFSVFFF